MFIRRRDIDFLLYDFLQLETILEESRFQHLDRTSIDSVIETSLRIATDHFASHADWIDRNEPEFRDGQVYVPEVVGEAVEAFADAGLLAAGFDLETDGMQLPETVVSACFAIFDAANVSTAGYPLLTVAAARLLQSFGDDELKDRFLPRMLAGEVMGTMCLSEPDAGSSLGDLRTMAKPADDGTYRLFGRKMWISGAGHDLTDNIVHFVLARIEGAPAGTRGISLFAVPRWLEGDGERRRNDVQVAGVNHKMGYRGITNCALNFGEEDGAVGWLVGEEHRGLRQMFQMMNEARIGVGMAATMSAHAAYLYALDYARERRQGRHPDERSPDTKPVPIIEHADVRRMLLQQKAYIEGAWGLVLHCARLVDEVEVAEEESERERKQLLLDLLTPIAKAWPSEFCLKANELAIQVLGGYGYSREYPVERHYRDNRLNAIHEGTNGIQALDLLGRKVTMQNGAAFRALMSEISDTVAEHIDDEHLGEFATTLGDAVEEVTATTMTLGQTAMEGNIRLFLANAHDYLVMLGHLVVGWVWLRQAAAAQRALKAGRSEDLLRGKLAACRYFFRRELPRVTVKATLLRELEDTPLATPPSQL
jgi:butyryl-CoA dehydrogenase